MVKQVGRSDPPLLSYLQPIKALAEEAGEMILAVYNTDFQVSQKHDHSPLTAADMAAHDTISAGLEELTPELPILSEESAHIPFSERNGWNRYWLIDPLDGTREFVKRNGEFTVNIALIKNHRAVLGVVHVPVLGVTYFAGQGGGSFKSHEDSAAEPIAVRKLPAQPTVAGSRSHPSPKMERFLQRLGPHELITIGSALKSCLVAEGRADIYPRLGPTSEWDTAAAQCIVEEAGGHLTDTSLLPLRYNTKATLLNPEFLVFGDNSYDWASCVET